MKVSIVTVCFNSIDTIEQTLNSVLSQTYPDIEYIVIDGGSTDGTLDILKKYRNQIHRYVSEPDHGIYNAMNKGIRLAAGDIVATLNSDDVYADETIVSRMAEFMRKNNLDAAYGDLVYTAPANTTHITRVWKAGKYKKNAFRHGWVMPHPTFFCKNQFFERYGYFDERFQIAADFELMLRFVEKHKINVGYLPEVIVKMRSGGKANVLRGMIRGNWEILKSFRLNGLHLSPCYFVLKPIIKLSQILKRTT